MEDACREDRGLRVCSALVPSFDGTPIDVTVTLPARRAPRRGRPLVVFLHGLLTDKSEYLDGGVEYKTVRWSNRWFAERGYAVLNYSARGHGASGGSIELASRKVEVRDARWLVSSLADATWAGVDPARVGVIGSSYGGGQAWLLLTTRDDDALPFGVWRSPGGRMVRLAALVPTYTWTDLMQSLLPNGLATPLPLGVPKQTLLDGFLATSGNRLPSYARRWLLRMNAGEPYDPAADATLAEAQHALTVDRSAISQDGYFAAVARDAVARRRARARRKRVPQRRQPLVPILAAQGWTDPIFPPIEALRMYRRLRAANPGFPVGMYLGDFEHLTALVKVPDLATMHDRGTALLDWALRARGRRPRFDVQAAISNCDPEAFGPVVRAANWDALAPAAVTYELAGPRLLTSATTEGRGAESDPVVVSSARGRGCITTRTEPGAASWTVAPAAAFTLIGLPRLTVRMRMAGDDATLLSRLWDVAPDGTATLVTRGALRLRPAPSGPVVTEMAGNAWRFEPGHRLQLELTQTDAPFFRPDSLPSSVEIESVRLELPAR